VLNICPFTVASHLKFLDVDLIYWVRFYFYP